MRGISAPAAIPGSAFWRFVAFEVRSGIRNRSLLLLHYLFPLGFYLMAGSIMVGINPAFRETMVAAFAVFTSMAASVLGLPEPLVNARESGVLRNWRVHGIPPGHVVSAPVLASTMHAVVVTAAVAASAPAVFGATPAGHFGRLLLIGGLCAAAHGGLGVLIGVVSTNARVTILWSQLVFLPSVLLGGLMVPTSMLPIHFQRASLLLPAAHAMRAMGGSLPSATVLAAGALVAWGLSVYLFDWDRRDPARKRPAGLALLAAVPYLASAWMMR